ncbi:hypothetical protein ABGB12_27680 [Actinocorallia sp. B10E7]|uniref:hypothetical protein n=1 Tax=Actinocorallia sp. B10E7 TaxID=3153558 RepID=UPI00325E9CD4
MPTSDDVQHPEQSSQSTPEPQEAPAPEPEAAVRRPSGRPKKRLPIPPLTTALDEPSV